MPDTHKLRALLVAVDQYHPHSHQVSNLQGCKNDILAFSDLIERKYSHLQPEILMLKDEEATRNGIIQAFRTHLRDQADENTTTLFYFSGHGSQQAASKVFQKYVAAQKYALEETLICHDSRAVDPETDQYMGEDLADKELAILIHELSQKQAHVVVILDCCHSGSATRLATQRKDKVDPEAPIRVREVRNRNAKGKEMEEALERTYLDGYYQKMLEAGHEVTIPRGKHILLSACQKDQSAHEVKRNNQYGGAFSFYLLKTLEENEPLVYGELFSMVHQAIHKESFQGSSFPQNPQFETQGFFDTNTIFLEGKSPSTRPKRFLCKFTKSAWKVELGATTGLSSEVGHSLKFAIYDHPESEEALTYAHGTSVGVSETQIDPESAESLLDTKKNYWAALISLPTPQELVYLEGSPENVAACQSLKSPYLTWSHTQEGAKYGVYLEQNSYRLYEQGEEKYQHPSEKPFKLEQILGKLEQMVRWRRLLSNQNPQTRLAYLDFSLVLEAQDKIQKMITEPDEEQTESHSLLNYEIPCQKGRFFQETHLAWVVLYQIKGQNKSSKDLYFTLLYFSPDYGIEVYFNELVPKKSDEIVLVDGYGLNPKDKSLVVDHFKLLVSTVELKPYYFTQPSLHDPQLRDSLKLDTLKKPDDWLSKTLAVKVLKVEN